MWWFLSLAAAVFVIVIGFGIFHAGWAIGFEDGRTLFRKKDDQ